MLITLAELKAALGITDNTQDVLLNSCILQANGAIAGYIGTDVSDTQLLRTFTDVIESHQCFVKLPLFPAIEVTGITVNGDAVLESTGWWLNTTHGIVENLSPTGFTPSYAGRYGARVTVVYRAGYEVVPADLKAVCLNIASALYANGGKWPTTAGVGTGELKSLTMFDAMSMSFDTGSSSDEQNTPAGMLGAWSFILDAYRVREPALA